MPTNKPRREMTRQQLQRQLEQRRATETRRRKTILITSIAVTVAVIAGIVIAVIVVTSGNDDSSAKAAPCSRPGGPSVTFHGVTVNNATNLKSQPNVTSSGSDTPTVLECQDLLVGSGPAASPSSTVKVQYTGVLYKNGTEFDSSWSKGGKPVQFSLTGVVPGFTQGIGGNATIAPMRVGGRRLMILPASLGYGAKANGAIPGNSVLVFVVDLTSVS